jgi:hypothetical protein
LLLKQVETLPFFIQLALDFVVEERDDGVRFKLALFAESMTTASRYVMRFALTCASMCLANASEECGENIMKGKGRLPLRRKGGGKTAAGGMKVAGVHPLVLRSVPLENVRALSTRKLARLDGFEPSSLLRRPGVERSMPLSYKRIESCRFL